MVKTILFITFIVLLIIICTFIHRKIIRKIKSNKKQKLLIICGFVILIMVSYYILGYRLTPLSASRANSFIGEEFTLINDLDLDWAYIHFYYDEENDKYYTIISEKKLFMYVSRNSVWHYGNNGDAIRTLGSISYTNGKGNFAQLLMVDSNDKNIDSIIIKDRYSNIETKINVDKPQIILLDDYKYWSQLDVIAVDEYGTELYYYGYPKDTNNVTRVEDYKWHVVEKNEEGK